MKPRGRWNRVISRLREIGPFDSATRGHRLQPERRSGMRIMTLKNAAWFALSMTVLFFIFTAYMERRSRGAANYGRLYDSRIDETRPATPRPQPEIVTEAPERPVMRRDVLQDSTDQDPLDPTTSADAVTTASTAPAARQPVRLRRSGERVVISGGTEGVRVDVQPPTSTATAPPPR